MVKVSDLICPVTFEQITDTPVMTPCGHTFSYSSLFGVVKADVSKSADLWAFWEPGDYECPSCKQAFTMSEIVVNDQWQEIMKVVNEWQAQHPDEDVNDQELSEIGAGRFANVINIRPSEGENVFSEEVTWTYCQKIKFVFTSVIGSVLALIAEVILMGLYMWDWGFITKEQYIRFRDIHVIQRLTPLYLSYKGIDSERPNR